MKSLIAIKSILPLLGTLQAGGVFSNPAAIVADNWTMYLGEAAIEDGIDLSDMLSQFDKIAKATDFEAQQDEMATAAAMLNQLLDDIPAGNVPLFVAPPEGFRSVRLRLANSIIGNMDAFRPDPVAMDKMRKDAALLATLAQSEDKTEDVNIAGQVYDLVDRSMDAPYNARLTLLRQARNSIERIAA